MFSNLSRGSVLYGLDTKDDIKLFTATVDRVTLPYPRNAQTTFGQLPEMVVDIVVNVNGERKEFKQVPSNNAIADFGPNTLVLSDTKDSLVNYVKSLRQTSQSIVESAPKHEKKIPQYDRVLQELNPELINESAVKELREQVGSLQSQLAEALALLKSGNTKTN
jgi:hypothetical protein